MLLCETRNLTLLQHTVALPYACTRDIRKPCLGSQGRSLLSPLSLEAEVPWRCASCMENSLERSLFPTTRSYWQLYGILTQ